MRIRVTVHVEDASGAKVGTFEQYVPNCSTRDLTYRTGYSSPARAVSGVMDNLQVVAGTVQGHAKAVIESTVRKEYNLS